MRRLAVFGVLLAVAFVARADDDPSKKEDAPKTAAEKFQAIQKDRNKAMRDYSTAMRTAKTNAERQKVFAEKYPRPEKFAERYLKLAKEHSDDPAEVLIGISLPRGALP